MATHAKRSARLLHHEEVLRHPRALRLVITQVVAHGAQVRLPLVTLLAYRAVPPGGRSVHDVIDAQAIHSALERNGDSRAAAARELGIHKTTLFRRMKKLGIPRPKRDGRSSRRPLRSE